MQIPLVISKKGSTAKKDDNSRPQDPKNFPYQQEEVKIKNEEAGVTLAGTLTLPEKDKPKAIVILISGSGPQNRNEELFNHRPFLVLSDYLTRRGIGVLRYDDRGVAESTGNHATATTKDFVSDAAAILSYVKTRKDLAGIKVGFAGHSEGGVIAPMVYSEYLTFDFMILLAGPSIPSDQLMAMQTRRNLELSGAPASLVDLNTNLLSI